MQVYLPDDLYAQVKSATSRLNVSGILQVALAARIAELARLDALKTALDTYQDEFGAFSETELECQIRTDAEEAITPSSKSKRKKAA